MTQTVPVRRFLVESMNTSVGSLLSNVERNNRFLDEQGFTGRRVLGFRLPDWQREHVWTEAQNIRFIESVYMGASIGSFMLNCTEALDHDLILLDGQQRLTAIELYVGDAFPIPGADGISRY